MPIHGEFLSVIDRDEQKLQVSFRFSVNDYKEFWLEKNKRKLKRLSTDEQTAQLSEFIVGKFAQEIKKYGFDVDGLDSDNIQNDLKFEEAVVDWKNERLVFDATYYDEAYWEDYDDDNY